MKVTYLGNKNNSTKTIVRAFEYLSLSEEVHNCLRKDFELSRVHTLTRLTSKVKSVDDRLYLKDIFANLTYIRLKTFVLLLHEIYVKTTLQYNGWIVFGTAVNKPHLLANALLNFMILTLFVSPKFLCQILPVRKPGSKFIFEQKDLILDAVENAGENNVTSICCGNWE